VDLLNKTSPETSSPQSVKSTSPSLPNDTAKNMDGVSQSKNGEDIFSNLLINKASTSYQQNTALVAGKNLDLQSKLQALTAGEKSALVISAPDAITIAQNMSAAMETHAQAITSPQSDKVVAASTLKDASKPITSNTMPDAIAVAQNMSTVITTNAQVTMSIPADKATASSTLNDAPIPTMSDIMPDATAIAQNMSAVMTINAPVVINIPSDKTSTMLTETQNNTAPMPPSDLAVVASDSLQKEAAPNQSAQSGQASDLPSFDTLLSSEKTQAIKDLLTTSDAGQLATGVSRDIAGAQQPVITNKIESPVLTKPLTHPEWSKDLGNQIIWMNSKELSTAEIKMNPEHLGPISVRIDLTQDQASVEFTAQHAAVKEALEASIPKLREMLGTQQLNLTNVTISQSTTSDQGQSQSPYQSFSRTPERQEQGTEGVATGLSEEAAANRIVVNKGLLSVYA
jgi:flagellar hook-length control protein FliK